MIDKFGEIRLFLIRSGFVATRPNGLNYMLEFDNIVFEVYLDMGKVTARYPDKKYNAANPYSTKDKFIEFQYNIDDMNDHIINDIDEFLKSILKENNIGYDS